MEPRESERKTKAWGRWPDLTRGWRDRRCRRGWGQDYATLRAIRCSEGKGAASHSQESPAPHPTGVCVVFPSRRAVGASSHLRSLSLRLPRDARCGHPTGPLCSGPLRREVGCKEELTGPFLPLRSTWRGWVTGRASVQLACLWLRVCGCGCIHAEFRWESAFPQGPSSDFPLLAVLGRAQLGLRAGMGPAFRFGWLQVALGSVGSRALKLQGEAQGGRGGWCAEAGALGPARLCSQPPLHMQRGSPAARGGSSAESGKPVKGGAWRAGAGQGSPRSCGGGDGGSPSYPTPTLGLLLT